MSHITFRVDAETRWWIMHLHHHSDKTIFEIGISAKETVKTVEEVIVNGTDPETCDHPNIVFEDDRYDEEGKRTCKHNWTCPACGYLQVG